MKKEVSVLRSFFVFFALLVSASLCAQTFYTENFNNGCASNCLATAYPGWSVTNNVGGTNGSAPNVWYVSCAEEGITPPGCGSSCIGDACLHIGANSGGGGDMGASFNETGATNATFRRAVSPSISTIGRTNIVLGFDFIAYGSSACSDDRAQLHLSADNGVTWPVAYQFCLNAPCCGACNGYSQGQWTAYTYTLPAAFENVAGIRIGFHWRNNGNGSGTDPSVAIDDITLTQLTVLPITLTDFFARRLSAGVVSLNWTSVTETNFSHFDIERSVDGINFSKIGKVNSKGNPSKNTYIWNDKISDYNTPYYYRLKMIDKDASFNYSKIVSSGNESNTNENITLLSSLVYQNTLKLDILTGRVQVLKLEAFDVSGKLVLRQEEVALHTGSNILQMDISQLAGSMYLLKISKTEADGREKQILTHKFVKAE